MCVRTVGTHAGHAKIASDHSPQLVLRMRMRMRTITGAKRAPKLM